MAGMLRIAKWNRINKRLVYISPGSPQLVHVLAEACNGCMRKATESELSQPELPTGKCSAFSPTLGFALFCAGKLSDEAVQKLINEGSCKAEKA